MQATPIPFADIQAVFLDAGNTLIAMNYESLSSWIAEVGGDLSPARLERGEAAARPVLSRFLAGGVSSESGDSLQVYVTGLLQVTSEADSPCAGGSSPDIDLTLRDRIVAHLRVREVWDRLWTKVPEGVPDALARMRASGRQLIVVSNSDGEVDRRLRDLGLLDLVDDVVDSGTVGHEKPDPRIFEHAVMRARTTADRCVHVGDLYSVDIVGARAAGVHAVLLDPFDDWSDYDCYRCRDLAAFADELLAGAVGET